MDPREQLKAIDRKIALTGILDAPGAILVGLGLYARNVGPGNTFHPLLDSDLVVNVMLGVGGAIMAWGLFRTISLGLEKKRLRERYGEQP